MDVPCWLRGGIIAAHVLLRIQIDDPPLLSTVQDKLFQGFSCYRTCAQEMLISKGVIPLLSTNPPPPLKNRYYYGTRRAL